MGHSVSATDKTSGKQKELEVKPTYNLNINKMKDMIKDSIRFASSDIEERLLAEAKIDAQRFLNELSSLESDLVQICSKEELKKIREISEMLKAQIKDDNRLKIQELIKDLDTATQNFSEKRVKKSIKTALVGKKYDKL